MGVTLLILAAGMASRYGSLKQIDQVGPSGETIMEYSIYDAIKAGFNKVVFVIRPDMEKEFKELFIKKMNHIIDIDYVFQDITMIPSGFTVPPNRIKPWGTSHAVWVAANKIKEPFAVINADDFYGMEAYKQMSSFLSNLSRLDTSYSMIGYDLTNTLSEFGPVSRGICKLDENSSLISITELTKIASDQHGIFYQSEDGQLISLESAAVVSMNFFGFTPAFFNQINEQFKDFLTKTHENPKAEIYIPLVIDALIRNHTASVKVLLSHDKWFGVTYKEDKSMVVAKLSLLVQAGIYPKNLWE